MKKLILSALIALTAFTSFAEPTHLSFKGVPMDGTVKNFVKRLEKKGLNYECTEDEISYLTGDFAGFKNCVVCVTSFMNRDLVSVVGVFFRHNDSWSGVSNDYYSLKEMLTLKYGEPASCVEEFIECNPIDNRARMHHLAMDRCNYSSMYETENGRIELMIQHEGLKRAFAVLRYTDKVNGNTLRAAAFDDL